jgi:hypothetical protein
MASLFFMILAEPRTTAAGTYHFYVFWKKWMLFFGCRISQRDAFNAAMMKGTTTPCLQPIV